jgi:soluble lytic murein transglycosylase
VLSTLGEELARGPVPGREEAWWLAWPLAWDAQVQRWAAASDGSVEPALVWAIMREESGYRPAVVSTAGARGLLQIMPTTGERLAQDSGLSAFSTEDLFEPAVNIRLGAHYLDQLSRRFRGRPAAAIGSYNAGPDAVARWIEERPALPDDEWVESVPYSQTRRYVKRVLRSIHAYRALY